MRQKGAHLRPRQFRASCESPLFSAVFVSMRCGQLVEPCRALLNSGVSASSILSTAFLINRLIGYHRNAVRKVILLKFPEVMDAPCKCGLSRRRQGWCKARFANSPLRRAVLRLMHINGSRVSPNRRGSAWILLEKLSHGTFQKGGLDHRSYWLSPSLQRRRHLTNLTTTLNGGAISAVTIRYDKHAQYSRS